MRAIVLIDHGSRSEEANASLETVVELVRSRVGEGVVVTHAHMDLAKPTLAEAVDAMVQAGAKEIVVVPYFLAPGRHSREDIPKQVTDAQLAHPHTLFVLAEPLGPHALLAELALLRAGE